MQNFDDGFNSESDSWTTKVKVQTFTLQYFTAEIMNKITRYADIPQFTRDGNWQCDYRWDKGIEAIQEWVAQDNLQLNPDFQRLHVWTEAQQIAFIEFFMRGGKTGNVIYLNHPGWQRGYKGEFVLVDGKQRIEALRRFRDNEIPLFGSFISEFTDKPTWTDCTLKINVNTLSTRAEVLQWYLDMNSGGTPHTAEEIEKARKLLEAERK